MPAVSTSSTLRPSTSIGVSIASRVVPATSETITRSRPRKRVDERGLADVRAPDHRQADGRPPRAPRLVVGRQQLDEAVEQVAGAEPLRRRDRPAARRARGCRSRATSATSRGESILLAASTTGTPPRRSISATSASPARIPARASTTSSDDVGVGERLARPGRWIETRERRRRPRGRRRRCRSARSWRPFQSRRELLAVARDARRLVHDGLAATA